MSKELNNAQWLKMKGWVLSNVKECGALSIQEGIESEMNNYLSGTARAVLAMGTKKYGMNLVDKLWQAFAGYKYMSNPPPAIKEIT